jgi:hypothetical protein
MRVAICRVVIITMLAQIISPLASAQTQERTATTTAVVSVYDRPDATKQVLRVAKEGSVLVLLAEQGDWCRIEFQDPDYGRRIGYVETKFLRLSATSAGEGQALADLSAAARRTTSQGVPQSQPPNHAGDQALNTTPDGVRDGELLGDGIHTGGKVGVGVAIGVLTGLIGTGIGYFVIGPETLSPEAFHRSSLGTPDYQLGFKSGWEKKTESKKRNAFLAGGLLGTAAWVALLVSANN